MLAVFLWGVAAGALVLLPLIAAWELRREILGALVRGWQAIRHRPRHSRTYEPRHYAERAGHSLAA